jgi:phage host-nuclease inhibitor protein Gam
MQAMLEPTAPPMPIEEPEQFTIDTIERANWYLRKLANLEAEKRRVLAQAEQIVTQLDADAESLRYLYQSSLENLVRQELARTGNRRKSLTLLQGTCSFRTVAPSVKIADTQAALLFVKESLPEMVRTVETLDLIAYKERAESRLRADGELLPGVEVVPERESFSVRFGRKED